MPDYIDFPIPTDPDELAQLAFDYLAEQIPGFVPAAGNLDTIFVEAIARIAAVVGTLASTVPTSIFRAYGPLIGLNPIDATPATAQTTWTLRDDAGYTIPAGTQVGVRAAGDQLVPFKVLTDIVVAPGATATAGGAVTIVAAEAGAAGSGLGTTGGPVELVDLLDYVTGITLVAPTSGGVDAESDSAYLNRLRLDLQLLTPRPILAPDFAALARNTPGVDRALAIDNYDPVTGTSDNERMVAVAVIDANGNQVTTAVKAAVTAALQAQREVNFVVNVIDPTYTVIDVSFTITVLSGFVEADVVGRAIAAVASYLSPANWGLAPTGDQRVWLRRQFVRYLELATVINNVQGVDEVTGLSLGVHGGAMGTDDVALAGAAALPQPGSIVGVTA